MSDLSDLIQWHMEKTAIGGSAMYTKKTAAAQIYEFAAENGWSDEDVLAVFNAGLEKIASAEDGMEKTASEMFADAIEKVAYVTGLEPEDLADQVIAYRDALVKEAQIDALVDALTDDEASEILREKVASDPEFASAVAQIEEDAENNELAYMAGLVDSMSDEQAQRVLQQVEG